MLTPVEWSILKKHCNQSIMSHEANSLHCWCLNRNAATNTRQSFFNFGGTKNQRGFDCTTSPHLDLLLGLSHTPLQLSLFQIEESWLFQSLHKWKSFYTTIIFVALLYIVPSSTISFLRGRDQNCMQNSICECTRDLYTGDGKMMFSLSFSISFLTIPSDSYSCFYTSSAHWSDIFREFSVVTPRSLSWVVTDNSEHDWVSIVGVIFSHVLT